MRYKVKITMVLFCIVWNANAKINPLIKQFTIEEGLSHNRINCIYQDSYGYLWIGTNDGLNRYDGYKFEIYRNSNDDNASLSNNMISSITEDAEGNIWVGTQKGLNKLNRSTKQFTRYFSTNPI